MDTRFGGVLLVVIILAVIVGVAAAQTQPKQATPAVSPVVPTAMVPITTAPVVQIVPRPSAKDALPGCDLTLQTSSVVYCPYRMTIKVGGTVIWVNWDKEPHVIIADDGSFQSKVLSPESPLGPNGTTPDMVYEHTFKKSGTFTYSDYLHPEMHGVVVVTR